MALSRSEEETRSVNFFSPTATREEILPYLETTQRVHDDVLDKRGPSGENWQTFLKPLNASLAAQTKYLSVKKYEPKLYTPLNAAEENANYKALCRGVKLRVSYSI